jgi:hypothetical protein
MAPLDEVAELDELPVPVGPRGIVELEVWYGTEDCKTEELAPPETLEDETYPELNGPTEEDVT